MRKKYYDKRQIIDVTDFGEIDFDEDILICVPRFAWLIARSYLSVQGGWLSNFAVEYFIGGYETPSSGQFDVIQANIARFLGETDMSCDLEAVLQLMVDQLEAIASKDCSVELSCNVGSSGAGGAEAAGSIFEDLGTDPPYGFDTYGEYEAWKCGVAHYLVDIFEQDLEYIKDLALTEFSAVLFAATLVSPIPGDEIGGLVAFLAAMFLEATLDALLSAMIANLVGDGDELVCALFLAVNVVEAKTAFSDWTSAFLSTAGQFVASYWRGNDNFNRLFEKGNLILPSDSCIGCSQESEVFDSFTDDDDVTLPAHTPEIGGPWIAGTGAWKVTDNQARSNGAVGSRVFIDGDLADMDVSVVLTPTSGGNKTAFQGVILRGSDNSNYISAGWKGGSSAGYWIAKRVAGSHIELEFVSAPETYEARVIQVKCDGSSIILLVNSVEVLSTTETFNLTETLYGMQSGQASGSRFDNFRVQPLV